MLLIDNLFFFFVFFKYGLGLKWCLFFFILKCKCGFVLNLVLLVKLIILLGFIIVLLGGDLLKFFKCVNSILIMLLVIFI